MIILPLALVGIVLVPLLRREYRTFSYAVRSAAIVLLMIALVDPALSKRDEGVHTAYILDNSATIEATQWEQMISFVTRSTEDLGRPDSATVVTFAAGARVVADATNSPDQIADLVSSITPEENPGRSDAGEAIDLAAALLPPSGDRRIVLLSDGLVTDDAVASAAAVRDNGVRVSTVFTEPAIPDPEVRLVDVIVPASVSPEETYTATIVYESRSDTRGSVTVLQDGVSAGTERLLFPPGLNSRSYQLRSTGKAVERVRVVVDADFDRMPGNNVIERIVQNDARPEILYISKEKDRPFAAALATQGYQIEHLEPSSVVRDATLFDLWDAIIIDNVSAQDLSFAAMSSLERYVRTAGGGVVVLGGRNAFGPGSYLSTPLELLLPVSADVTSRVQVPTLVLLFLVDTSGSMSGSDRGVRKLDIVKEALFASLDIMQPNQKIGLLAFDAETDWVVPIRRAGDREETIRDIASLQSGGGTVLAAALAEARDAMEASEAAEKHVVVLSDGLTREADFPALVAALRETGSTVSTISVGPEANEDLMETIAADGGGRHYHSETVTEIPQIFVEETSLVAREAIVEEPFFPVPGEPSPIWNGIDQGAIPALNGFVVTFPKNSARITLEGPGPSPVLAHWQYGLGKSAAFTSAVDGNWGRSWITWESLPRLAGQLTEFVRRQTGREGSRLSTEWAGDLLVVTLARNDRSGRLIGAPAPTLSVVSPDERETTGLMEETGPGRFRSEIEAPDPGTYLIAASDEDRLLARATVNRPYAREYARLIPDPGYLQRIARAGNGITVAAAEGAFPHEALPIIVKDGPSGRRLWPWLTAIAGLIFALETITTAVRRRQSDERRTLNS